VCVSPAIVRVADVLVLILRTADDRAEIVGRPDDLPRGRAASAKGVGALESWVRGLRHRFARAVLGCVNSLPERLELLVEALSHGVHLVAQPANLRFDVSHMRSQVCDVRLEPSDIGLEPRCSLPWAPPLMTNLRPILCPRLVLKSSTRRALVHALRPHDCAEGKHRERCRSGRLGKRAGVRRNPNGPGLTCVDSRCRQRSTMRAHYVLIDYENVQPNDLALLDGRPHEVVLFVGAQQTKVSLALAAALQPRGRYVQISGNGRDALDFHIAYELGALATKDPSACFRVISKDTGFDSLIEHLQSKELDVHRCESLAELLSPSEDQIVAVITRLLSMGSARPQRTEALANAINAVFGKTLEEAAIQEFIDALARRHEISVKDGKVTYPVRKS